MKRAVEGRGVDETAHKSIIVADQQKAQRRQDAHCEHEGSAPEFWHVDGSDDVA